MASIASTGMGWVTVGMLSNEVFLPHSTNINRHGTFWPGGFWLACLRASNDSNLGPHECRAVNDFGFKHISYSAAPNTFLRIQFLFPVPPVGTQEAALRDTPVHAGNVPAE
jgi:hypothetical protein